jgi:DNA-binding CsgD family transcriptional regulator
VGEVARQALEAGFDLVLGRCVEQDSAFPFAAVVDALRAFFAGRGPEEVRQILGGLAAEVVKLVPELGLLLPGLTSTPPLDPEAERRRLFEALLRVLTPPACRRPRLLLFEDVHWADRTSLDFLQFLIRRLPSCPVLLILTFRAEDSDRLWEFLAGIRRERRVRELTLEPLSREHVGNLIRAILGPVRPDPARLVDLVYGLTEGNPFFVEEVLRTLVVGGRIRPTASGWEWQPAADLRLPESLQDVVRLRLRRLGPRARALLTVAAVIGRQFELKVLADLTGLNEPEVLRLLNRLVTAQVITETSVGRFAFRHPIIREAVYQDLTGTERWLMHRPVARVLEGAGASESALADLSYHYFSAGAWAEALQYTELAGEQAWAFHAPEEAVAHFSRALEAALRLGCPVPVRVRLLHARGRAAERAGYADAARRDYAEAVCLARTAGDRVGEWEGTINLGLLWASRNYARARQHLDEALELAQILGEPALFAHSLNRVGNLAANVSDPGLAVDYHLQALEIFRQLDDRRGTAVTLDLLGMAAQLNSDLVGAVGWLRQAADLFRRLGDPQGLAASLASLVVCAATHPHDLSVPGIPLAEGLAAGDSALALSQGIGWRAGTAYTLGALALGLGLGGDYGAALAAGRSALQVAEEVEHRQWAIAAHRALGRLYLDIFALPEARRHLELAWQLAADLGSWVWSGYVAAALASVYIAQGEFGLARDLLDAGSRPGVTRCAGWDRQLEASRAELALVRHDPDAALAIVERLTAYTPNLGQDVVVARLWTLRGRTLAVLRRYEEAEALLLAAKHEAEGRGTPIWGLHACLVLGRVYRSWQRRVEAQAAFEKAQRVAESLAAGLPEGGLRAGFLRQVRTLLPGLNPRQAITGRYGGLTEREAQVASLVSRGLTNREIAEVLVVSERTVESHVASIMGKLGFNSRARVAAWAAGRGLDKGELG